jgi:hypothetical protein
MSIAFHPLPGQCEACGIGDCVTVPVLEPGLNVIRSNPWHQDDKKNLTKIPERDERSSQFLHADSEFPLDSLFH